MTKIQNFKSILSINMPLKTLKFLFLFNCNKLTGSIHFRGFHGDLNETLFVGEVSEKAKNLVINTWECLEKSILECVKPGVKYR